MNWVDYREKLGIGINDKQKFEMLKNNILEFLAFLEPDYLESDYLKYSIMVGEKRDQYLGNPINGVINSLENIKNTKLFLAKYIAFYNAFEPNDIPYKTANREKTKKAIIDYLENRMSILNIGYDIVKDSDGIFIFPKGASELDDALVSAPLEWLQDYPKARKTFCVALKQYSDGIYIRDVADNLRKTLEAFLQEFLNNNKNLESNKNEICKYLGEQNVDPSVTGLYHTIINSYKNTNDKTAKHDDKVDSKLLEFLLYQTGLLIRLIITIKQSEVNNHAN